LFKVKSEPAVFFEKGSEAAKTASELT